MVANTLAVAVGIGTAIGNGAFAAGTVMRHGDQALVVSYVVVGIALMLSLLVSGLRRPAFSRLPALLAVLGVATLVVALLRVSFLAFFIIPGIALPVAAIVARGRVGLLPIWCWLVVALLACMLGLAAVPTGQHLEEERIARTAVGWCAAISGLLVLVLPLMSRMLQRATPWIGVVLFAGTLWLAFVWPDARDKWALVSAGLICGAAIGLAIARAVETKRSTASLAL